MNLVNEKIVVLILFALVSCSKKNDMIQISSDQAYNEIIRQTLHKHIHTRLDKNRYTRDNSMIFLYRSNDILEMINSMPNHNYKLNGNHLTPTFKTVNGYALEDKKYIESKGRKTIKFSVSDLFRDSLEAKPNEWMIHYSVCTKYFGCKDYFNVFRYQEQEKSFAYDKTLPLVIGR